jgi:hypothetical protein
MVAPHKSAKLNTGTLTDDTYLLNSLVLFVVYKR